MPMTFRRLGSAVCPCRGWCGSLMLLAWPTLCLAAEVRVELPPGQRPVSGTAVARSAQLEAPGRTDGQALVFAELVAGLSYDLRIGLADGTMLQGVDLGWYSNEPPSADAGPITDDDRSQIDAILYAPQHFYNRTRLLALVGDHDRVTALVELVRDSAFHGDRGGEIIWRIEVWYFKNQAGGWEKLAQQNQVLRRERFRRKQDAATTQQIRWTPELGGIEPADDYQPRVIRLSPTTRPSESEPR